MSRQTKAQKAAAAAQPMMVPSGWMPAPPPPSSNIQRIALSIDETAEASGFSRSTVYEALSTGELKASRRGRKAVILVEEIRRWLVAMTGNAEPVPPPAYTKPGPAPRGRYKDRTEQFRAVMEARKQKP